jgi:hypothetical protein
MKSLSARDAVFDIGQFHCKFAADPRVFPDGALSQSCYRYPCRLLIQFKPGGLALRRYLVLVGTVISVMRGPPFLGEIH